MVKSHLIKNWIIIAIQQAIDDQSELFYFDKKENEFFSILNIDLFLFDKNFNIIEDVSFYFTHEELVILRNRLRRIRKKDSTIKELPRFGIIDSINQLNTEVTKFMGENSIDIDKVTLFETFQKDPIYPIKKQKKSWWKFW